MLQPAAHALFSSLTLAVALSVPTAFAIDSPQTPKACESLMTSKNQKIPATYLNDSGQIVIADHALVHGGKVVNTNKFRAPKVWTVRQPPGSSKGLIVVDNFLHQGEFYRARIPIDANSIKDVFVQTMPFPIVPGVMAGHIQARFVFHDGQEIELFDKKYQPTGIKVKDMIVSYEAALPKGESYNFALGAVDANPLVGRLVSGQQKLDEGPERQFNQYRIPLTPVEAAQLLYYYIRNASDIQMEEFYNTITRNCTTTIFDGLDSLERIKKMIEQGAVSPFLTTIGGDPVIGPAVNALLERFGPELIHVQDMKDEYKGLLQSYGAPAPVIADRLSFVPGGENPMALVLVTQDTQHLTQQERNLIDELIADIRADLPNTINMLLATAFTTADDLQKSPQIVSALTQAISEKLKNRLKNIQADLPENAIAIQILFSPYPTEDKDSSLEDQGLRARLPFPVVEKDLDQREENDFFKFLETQLSSVDSHAVEDIPAFLKGFIVTASISKTKSKVTTQILMGLQPLLKPVTIQNSQVQISQVQIPDRQNYQPSWSQQIWDTLNPWKKSESTSPLVSMLLTHEQILEVNPNPNAQVRFGSRAQVISSGANKGQLEIPDISNNRYLCWSGARPHTPRLLGTLAQSPLGQQGWLKRRLNALLSGREVALSIQELDLNLQELKIEATRIRIGILGLRCIELESVNQQFAGEANAKLKDLIEKIGPADIQLP